MLYFVLTGFRGVTRFFGSFRRCLAIRFVEIERRDKFRLPLPQEAKFLFVLERFLELRLVIGEPLFESGAHAGLVLEMPLDMA
jgi:hypothetical protein